MRGSQGRSLRAPVHRRPGRLREDASELRPRRSADTGGAAEWRTSVSVACRTKTPSSTRVWMSTQRWSVPPTRWMLVTSLSRIGTLQLLSRSGGELVLEPAEDVVQDPEKGVFLLRRAPSFAVHPVARDAEVGPAAPGDEHPARQR